MEELKYPIGKFTVPTTYDEAFRAEALNTFKELPELLRSTMNGVSIHQLTGKYRPDAWNIKQVVHHLADSHMNCLIRIKLGLTEELPTIKPYDENAWSALADANNDNIETSINIIEGVHARVVNLLSSLEPSQWERKVFHPQSNREMSINFILALYAWHGKHHLAHIKNALTNPY